MKKIIALTITIVAILGLSTSAMAQSNNPIVMRLSSTEIQQNVTPAAVAYNLVCNIALENWDAAVGYFTPEVRREIMGLMESDGIEECFSEFTNPNYEKLYIKGWLPALIGQWEIAVLYVQDEGYDEYGRECKKVYLGCVPSSQVNNRGFQDIQRYGNSNVKAMVVYSQGVWRVSGFK